MRKKIIHSFSSEPFVGPFTINEDLTARAILWHLTNKDKYIADLVLPRTTVKAKRYVFWNYDKNSAFRLQDDKVGATSAPNVFNLYATRVQAKTEDHALDFPIAQDDMDNSNTGFESPQMTATEALMAQIQLNRELRVATTVFNAATYPSGYKTQLTSQNNWQNTATNVIDHVMTGLSIPLNRPNLMVIGSQAWMAFRTHPQISKAVHGNQGDAGIASLKAIEDLFEITVVVGETWVDYTAKGQEASRSKLWGKHCALLYVDGQPKPQGQPSFGWTAVFGTPLAGTVMDPDVGMKGGVRVRAGESVDEKIVCPDMGYFIEDVVA